jgi:hypothetical protein
LLDNHASTSSDFNKTIATAHIAGVDIADFSGTPASQAPDFALLAPIIGDFALPGAIAHLAGLVNTHFACALAVRARDLLTHIIPSH